MRSTLPALSSIAACPALPALTAAAHPDAAAVSAESKRWAGLAVGSLVIAGLLSLLVVIGRLPGLSGLIGDPLFFKRCLVVHVDLALVVWFYAFLAALTGLRVPHGTGEVGRAAFVVATLGVGAMLAGALARGAQPVLSNYVPVIDHPLFLGGLGAFFLGILIHFTQSLAASSAPGGSAVRASGLPSDAVAGLQAAAIAVVLAAATAVSARAGLPGGLDARTHFEFLAWGPGHVLQVANAAAMLAVWLWLLARATSRPVMTTRTARWLFGLLLAPHFAMPLLTMRGTLNNLYHEGATTLMRWGVFPVVLVVLGLGVRHWWRNNTTHRAGAWSPRFKAGSRPPRAAHPLAPSSPRLRGCLASVLGPGQERERWSAAPSDEEGGPCASTVKGVATDACAARAALAGFAASVGLTLLGFILGACIRSSTTLVPAHYHASLGGVTVAFMAAAYLICDRATKNGGLTPGAWRMARRQLLLFFVGQSVFALGFAIGGAYGLGRKAYATEQHVRSAGEIVGLSVMGLGGLVAAAAGIWFLVLVLRAMRGWSWRTPSLASLP